MNGKALKKLIRETEQAAQKAEQTALRQARRGAQVKKSARRRENSLKFRIGGNAICYKQGDITSAEFHRRLAEDHGELQEIDARMINAGLRKRRGEKVLVEASSPEVNPQPTRALSAPSPGLEEVDVGFTRIPPEDLRMKLRGAFKLRYDPDVKVWRGRAVPGDLAAEIRGCNAGGLVRVFRINGVTQGLP